MKKKIALFMFLFVVLETQAQSLALNPFDYKYDNNTKELVASGNDDKEIHRFFFQSNTNVSTTEELGESFQGTQKFNLTLRLKVQGESSGIKNTGVDFSFGMNAINLKPTGVAKDSFDLVSLMFPEGGNFGFMATPVWHWYLKENSNSVYRLSTEISGSLRQNKVTDVYLKNSADSVISGPETVDFTTININVMPIRYGFYYQPDDDLKIEFNLGIYYNLFNIPNEDARSFNKLFPTDKPLFDVDKRSNIQSIGGKLSCGINGFLIFADVRWNMKTDAFEDNNAYKGTVFNIGIGQNLNIFKK